MKLQLRILVTVLALATAAFASGAKADRLAQIKERKTLICGVLNNVEPFGFIGSPPGEAGKRELVGYDVDFCKAVAAQLGVKPELKVLSLEARIPELTQGRVDILAAVLGYTAIRAGQIDFSDQYFVSEQKLAVQKGGPYKTRDDLNGKRISTIKGGSTQAFIQKELPQATMISFDDAPTAFMALVQKKVDGFGLSESLLRRFIARLGKEGNLEVLMPPLGREEWGLGIKKGEPALLQAVNDALQKMEQSGQAAQIFDNWLGSKTELHMERSFKVEPIEG